MMMPTIKARRMKSYWSISVRILSMDFPHIFIRGAKERKIWIKG
jgi:hypothetical protein